MTDNEFARAHDRWLTPPDDPPMKKCGECDGEGSLTDEQGNEDECHVCKGAGGVPITEDDIQEQQDLAIEEEGERREEL